MLQGELRPGEVLIAWYEKQISSAHIDPRTGVRTELGVSRPIEVAPLVRSQAELDDCVKKAGGEAAWFYAVSGEEAEKGVDR